MLADMMALKNGSVTKQDLLGVMAFYSNPDRPIPAHELAAAWAAEGLPTSMVPDGRQPVHIFQRACDNVKAARANVPSSNRVVEITSDQVVHNSTECIYQITRLVRDPVNQVINHKRAMTLRFTKAHAASGVDPIEVVTSDSDMDEVETKIRNYYAANLDTVHGQKVRNAVRLAILSTGATVLRDGCYFVPIDHLDTVECLQRVYDRLYGDDAFMHSIPWLNTDSTRKIVEKHHTANVRGECENITSEISKRLVKDSTPRSDFVGRILTERRELGQRIRDYRSMLGGEVEAAAMALELLDDQIENLLAKQAGLEVTT